MSDYKEIKEKLFYENKNAFLRMEEAEIEKAFAFCEGYKQFLNLAKTERERIFAVIDTPIIQMIHLHL